MKLPSHLRRQHNTILASIAAAESGPSEADLAEAPVIDRWLPLFSKPFNLLLWGEVTGHPELGTDYITTSQLLAVNADAGWARTRSRWYRLGVKERRPDFLQMELPGFTPIKDPAVLAEILAAYIARVRERDAMDRAESTKED
jgi:hypothetical protein